jgi:hypothetical protein
MTPRRLATLAAAARLAATLVAGTPPAAAQAPAYIVVQPPPAPPRSLADRTHNSIFPTGNLVAAGEVQFTMHELGLYNRAAFGVSDRLELAIGAPLIPVVVSAGARIAATPSGSRMRLVLGASVWNPINDDGDGEAVYQLSVTAGYRSERFEVHATAARFSPGLDGDQPAAAVSVGMSYQFGPKSALVTELGRIAVVGAGAASCDGSCDDDLALDGLLAGCKLMGERFDTDLGLLFVGDRDAREAFTLPVVSMTYRY